MHRFIESLLSSGSMGSIFDFLQFRYSQNIGSPQEHSNFPFFVPIRILFIHCVGCFTAWNTLFTTITLKHHHLLILNERVLVPTVTTPPYVFDFYFRGRGGFFFWFCFNLFFNYFFLNFARFCVRFRFFFFRFSFFFVFFSKQECVCVKV